MACAIRKGRTPGVNRATTALALAHRMHEPPEELERLRGVLKAEKMRAEIEAAVAQAPPFTDEQRRLLADLLVPGEGVRDLAG